MVSAQSSAVVTKVVGLLALLLLSLSPMTAGIESQASGKTTGESISGRAQSAASVSTIVFTVGDLSPQFSAQTTPVRRLQLDASLGVSVTSVSPSIYSGTVSLSNGTVLVAGSLMISQGMLPPFGPYSFNQRTSFLSATDHLRLQGLPYPSGTNFSSAAATVPSITPTTLLKSSLPYLSGGMFYLYDNGDLYYSRRMSTTWLGAAYVDILRVSQQDNTNYFTPRLVNSDPAFLNDTGGVPPKILRIMTLDGNSILAFASNGKIYAAGNPTIAGNNNTDVAFDASVFRVDPFRASVFLPALSQTEMENIDTLPVAMVSESVLIYTNGTLYGWGYSTYNNIFDVANNYQPYTVPFAIDLTSLLPETGSPTFYPANITKISINGVGSLLVLADGRCLTYSRDGRSLDSQLTGFVRSLPSGSSSIVSITNIQSKEHFLLLDDGSVWMYSLPDSVSTSVYAWTLNWINFNQNGPWKSDFGPALPPGYTIKSITCDIYYQTLIFHATAPAAASPSVPPQLASPPAKTQRLIAIDPYHTISYLEYYREMSKFDYFRNYPEPELNQIVQVSMGQNQMLVVTRNGSLLISGPSQVGVLPLDRRLSYTEPPVLSDQRPFGNQPILSAASGFLSGAAILADGRLAIWGIGTDMSTVTSPPTAPSAAPQAAYQPANAMPNGNRVTILSQPDALANFSGVYSNDIRYIATDTLGRLYSLGTWYREPFMSAKVLTSHPSLFQTVGAIKAISLSQIVSVDTGELWLVAGNSSAMVQVVRAKNVTLTGAAFKDSRFNYFTYPAPSDFFTARSMAAGSEFAIILTDSGLYGVGSHPLWFTAGGANGQYLTPTLVVMPGLPPTSQLKKVILDSDMMLALSYDGKLYSTCGANNLLTRCTSASAQVLQVAPRYNYSLLYDVGAPDIGFRPIAVDADTFEAVPRDLSTPHLTLITGRSTDAYAWGSTEIDGTDGQIRLLAEGHPLDSDNVTNIRFGFYASFDYQVSANTTLHSVQNTLLTGGSAYQYLPAPTAIQPSNDPDLIFFGALDVGIMDIYRNCSGSFYMINLLNDQTTVPPRAAVPGFAWTGFDPSQPIGSTEPSTASHHYFGKAIDFDRYDLSAGYGSCMASEATIEKAYCESMAEMFDTPSVIMRSYYCLMVEEDGTMWARGSWPLDYTLDDCSGAMYGEQSSCQNAVVIGQPSGPSGFPIYWITNQLPTSSMSFTAATLADASIGKRHVLILLTDGSVGVYGNNWRGQLGHDPLTMENSTQLIPVSLAGVFSHGSTASQVLASGRTSYAVSLDKTQIASWGNNAFGELGRVTSNPSGLDLDAYDWHIGLVNLPSNKGQITDFKCSDSSCFVLYGGLGEVYSWGSANNLNLGRRIRTGAIYDPNPAFADLLQFPSGGPPRLISEIHASKTTSTVMFRAMIGTPTPVFVPVAPVTEPVASPVASTIAEPTTPPTAAAAPPVVPVAPVAAIQPTPVGCSGTPPSSAFYCQNGIWVASGAITLGGSHPAAPAAPVTPGTPVAASPPTAEDTLPISSPTVIIGSLTVTTGGTVVFEPPVNISPETPLLNVTGCFNVSEGGSLALTITPANWEVLKTQLNSKTALLVESSCAMLPAAITVPVTTPKDCRKTTAKFESVALSSGRYGLQSTFMVNSNDCTQWWIILLCAIGGVLIATCIAVIVYRIVTTSNAKKASSNLKRRSGALG